MSSSAPGRADSPKSRFAAAPPEALLQSPVSAFSGNGTQSSVRVVAKDVNGDGIVDAIFAAQGADPRIRTIRRIQPLTSNVVDFIFESSPDFAGGYFVA